MTRDQALEFVRRDVKYPRIEYRLTDTPLIILPKEYAHSPEQFIRRHQRWLSSRKREIQAAIQQIEQDSDSLMARSRDELRREICSLASDCSKELGTSINGIYIRKMKTKWASCSPRMNITVNAQSSYLPNELLEYIIYHETVHSITRKHDANFWGVIERRFPDHRNIERLLFSYWFLIHKQSSDNRRQGVVGV